MIDNCDYEDYEDYDVQLRTLPLPANENGLDYIIGDIHGCYDRVIALLDHVGFDPSCDRVFSVGDLVDRGPDSMKCLELLNKQSFYAVYANHEDLMVSFMNGEHPGRAYWPRNGGLWADRAVYDANVEFSNLVTKSESLPQLITVEGQFHVIHAELCALKGPITKEVMQDPRKQAFEQSWDGDYIIWGRDVFGYAYGVNLEDPVNMRKYRENLDMQGLTDKFLDCDPIYSGHSIMQRPTKVGQLRNLDTGAYHSYWKAGTVYNDTPTPPKAWAGLSMTCHQTGQVWTAKHDGVHANSFIEVL